MKRLIKYRVGIITLLFSAFGGALAKSLDLYELTTMYIFLATLIAFVVNLLVSLFIQGLPDEPKNRRMVKLVAVVLFLLFLGATAVHINYFVRFTYAYEGYEHKKLNLIKGDTHDTSYINLAKQHPGLDEGKILDGMGGPGQNYSIWDRDGYNRHKLSMIYAYCAMALFFVALVSLVVEYLVTYRLPPGEDEEEWDEIITGYLKSLFRVDKPKKETTPAEK